MATKKPKGLGLGLEALLGPRVVDEVAVMTADSPGSSLRKLNLSLLQPGKYQPRTRMDAQSLRELADSIAAQGLMQPVLARPLAQGRFEIIAGERRVRAARLAGLEEVPVLIKNVPDEAAAVMSLIENIQREDLNPLEEAQGLKRLISEFGLTHEQAAKAVGRSRSAASNLLRLLQLADPVQKLLLDGELEMGHARALLSLDSARQILRAGEVVSKRLSVRQTEALVARAARATRSHARASRPGRGKSGDLLRIEEALSDALAAKVEIRVKKQTRHGDRGEVAIQFSSLDELNGLLDKLGLPVS